MADPRKPAFDGVRAVCPANPFNDPGNTYALHNLLDAFGAPIETEIVVTAPATRPTERIMLEILEHEGIVCEAYKDSVGVWTWGAGVTDSSGHKVARYRDKPTTILRCLEVYEWLLRTAYLPDVLKAFAGVALTEAQLGGALSFHWNTGAILKADWVAKFKAGDIAGARVDFMNWSKPTEVIARRKAERNLFFDGVWTSDGVVTVYDVVNKPSYAPKWKSARQVDVREMLRDVVGRAGE